MLFATQQPQGKVTTNNRKQDQNQTSFESLRNSKNNIKKVNVTDIQYQNQSVLRIKQESIKMPEYGANIGKQELNKVNLL